jgi:hypothetical protein
MGMYRRIVVSFQLWNWSHELHCLKIVIAVTVFTDRDSQGSSRAVELCSSSSISPPPHVIYEHGEPWWNDDVFVFVARPIPRCENFKSCSFSVYSGLGLVHYVT